MPIQGINIVREQSEMIEARTRRLIRYLLQQAVAHARSRGPHSHRAAHLALVGHCGYFARLSGHTLENCELVELEWGTILRRASVKGFLTLPPGMKHSDVADRRKQARLVRHWLAELGEPLTDDDEQFANDVLAEAAATQASSGAAPADGEEQAAAAAAQADAGIEAAFGFSATRLPPSSNTADLVPPTHAHPRS
jgi:hypothetical protein